MYNSLPSSIMTLPSVVKSMNVNFEKPDTIHRRDQKIPTAHSRAGLVTNLGSNVATH